MFKNLICIIKVFKTYPSQVCIKIFVFLTFGLFLILFFLINAILYKSVFSFALSALGFILGFYIIWAIVPQIKLPFQSKVWKGIDLLDSDILLTFDDAPSKYTNQILDVLDINNIKAIFFVIGQNCLHYPDKVKEIISRGHVIGCHGMWHKKYLFSSKSFIQKDIKECMRILSQNFKISPNLFRSPHGFRNFYLANIIGLFDMVHLSWHRGFWDTDPNVSTEELILRAKEITKGEILLFHDGIDTVLDPNRSNFLTIFPNIINMLQNKGFSFADPRIFIKHLN